MLALHWQSAVPCLRSKQTKPTGMPTLTVKKPKLLLNKQKEYVDKKFTAPLAVRDEVTQNGVESQPMIRNVSAMAVGIWSNQILAVSNAAGHSFEITTYPGETAERYQYIKPSQFFSVASNSEYPEMAVKFIDGVTNDIDMNMELKAERGVPISSAMAITLFCRISMRDARLAFRLSTSACSAEFSSHAAFAVSTALARNSELPARRFIASVWRSSVMPSSSSISIQ